MENSERDGTIRPPDLPPEKPVCRSTYVCRNNICMYIEASVRTGHGIIDWFPSQERCISRLNIVTLFIKLLCRVYHEKCQAR